MLSYAVFAALHPLLVPAYDHFRTGIQGKRDKSFIKYDEADTSQASAAQLLTIPPYALASVLTVSVAVFSERIKRRAVVIVGCAIVAIIGYIILLTNENPTKRPGVSYVGTFFAAAGIYPAVALALSWPANNVSGQTKRATANALQITIGNLGAVIGTQLYRPKTSPRYVLGHSVALGYLCANILVTLTLLFVLRRDNRKRDEAAARGDLYDGEYLGDEDPRWRYAY